MTVARLPVQHPHHPHCPHCDAALPTFDGVSLFCPQLPDAVGRVIALTLHYKCECGNVIGLRKETRGESDVQPD